MGVAFAISRLMSASRRNPAEHVSDPDFRKSRDDPATKSHYGEFCKRLLLSPKARAMAAPMRSAAASVSRSPTWA